MTVTGTVQGLTTNNDIVFDEATNDLTLAVADQASGVATLTVPDLGSVSGDIVVNNASQTLTNKNLVDNSTVLEDETDNTKQLQFELSGITSGNTRTLTVPDANGTISLTTDFDEASEISYDNTTSGLTATNVQAAIDELDNALDGGVATPTLQQVYTQGNTITTNATDGSVTIAGDQALNVSTSGGLNVTSLLDVDNLRLDGNTVSSTSGDLLIAASSNLDLDGSNVTIDAASNQDITLTTTGTGRVNIPLSNITGGSISGITDLAIADGGTGASDAATARTNLGLGTIATQDATLTSPADGDVLIYDASGTQFINESAIGFEAYLGSTASYTDGSKIQFDTETAGFDDGTNYDESTNHEFTVPKAGIYNFEAGVEISYSGNQLNSISLYIDVDGGGATPETLVARSSSRGANSDLISLNISKTLKLAAGTVVYIRYNGSTNNIQGGRITYFSGHLVR